MALPLIPEKVQVNSSKIRISNETLQLAQTYTHNHHVTFSEGASEAESNARFK